VTFYSIFANVFIFKDFHLEWAAFFAVEDLVFLESFIALAFPPFKPPLRPTSAK
jgi:hypothetical protein